MFREGITCTKMKREAIQGALICLSLKFRIPVLRSLSPEETGNLMIGAYYQLTDCKWHLPNRPAVCKKRDNRLEQQIFILQGPGSSWTNARQAVNG